MTKKILYRFLLLVMIGLFSMNATTFAADMPEITATSAILVEASTGNVLYEKDSTEKMYPASMTKILTALVTLDYFSPDTLITAGNEINEIAYDSSRAGHVRGETLTAENLIRGLIIPSGNDSANVLAAAVAKKVKNDQALRYEDCAAIFADLMNEKAKALGAVNTHFTNSHGYHDENHYTTAQDMAKITIAAMKNDTIKTIAQETTFIGNGVGDSIETETKLRTKDYNWTSHNLLITDGEYHYEYATGLKTGFTDEAGDCIAATATKDGINLVAIIFNSPDPERWQDAKTLFGYGFENFSFNTVQTDGDVVAKVSLSNHNQLHGDTVNLIVKEDIKDFVAKDFASKLEKKITYREDLIAENKTEEDTTIRLKAPLEKDEEVGTIAYQIDGETKYESKIYTEIAVEKSTVLSSIKYFFKNLSHNLLSKNTLLTIISIAAAVGAFILFIKLLRSRHHHRKPKYRYSKKMRRK